MGEELLMEILTYMVGIISVIAVVLMAILIFQIYDEDHPLNKDRPDENVKID